MYAHQHEGLTEYQKPERDEFYLSFNFFVLCKADKMINSEIYLIFICFVAVQGSNLNL